MTPPSLPGREEIAARAREYVTRHVGGAITGGAMTVMEVYEVTAAFAEEEVARLRPAWEAMETSERALRALVNGAKDIMLERDALREQVAACVEAIQYLDRVLVAEGLMPGIGFSPLWMAASAAMKTARAALARVQPEGRG